MPRIAGDGSYVVLKSTHPYAEPGATGAFPWTYRIRTDGIASVEPIGSKQGGAALAAPSSDGSLALLYHGGDFTDSDPDGSGEVYLVDFSPTPGLWVSPGSAPTRVNWDFVPGHVRYDVVRGDLANLRLGAEVIDLVEIRCVENGSPDADTAGDDGSDAPVPGQGFFHVMRGSMGCNDGPDSWGSGANGWERQAGPGFCSP
jgi:hypothetical protein